MSDTCVLGIDTSNYTTSVAILSKEKIIKDERTLLPVKSGQNGLRQSEALFLHTENLPNLIEKAFVGFNGKIKGVAVSSRPRPLEGSYMPVFKAGIGVGKSISKAMNIPYFEFSHQEGHIAAVKPENFSDFQCFHLSGGTCELLHVNKDIKIIGGSKDISFGQLVDRIGVELGFTFPAGKYLDEIAKENTPANLLREIKVIDKSFNLSGIETQVKNLLKAGAPRDPLIAELFQKIALAIIKTVDNEKTLLVGGVASSETLKKYFKEKKNIIVPQGHLATDNAVGIAKLGGEKIWQ